MKWLKICSLLLVTLGAMRMGSWAIRMDDGTAGAAPNTAHRNYL
jgi:hypothetical protein